MTLQVLTVWWNKALAIVDHLSGAPALNEAYCGPLSLQLALCSTSVAREYRTVGGGGENQSVLHMKSWNGELEWTLCLI